MQSHIPTSTPHVRRFWVVAAGTTMVMGVLSGAAYGSHATRMSYGIPSTAAGDILSPQSVTYPVNESGFTYGSAADAPTPADEPDLVAVLATNGKVGYAWAHELDAASGTPQNPSEAIAWTLSESGASGTRVVPVYEVDGVTLIGEFVVGG